MNLNSLISTSVSDAKTSLELLLARDPAGTARDALTLLEQLQGEADQTSRRKMLAGVVRKAAKKLSDGLGGESA